MKTRISFVLLSALFGTGCVLKYPPSRNSRFAVDVSQMEKAEFLHDTWVYRHPAKRVRDYSDFWLSSVEVFPKPVRKISRLRRTEYDALENRLRNQIKGLMSGTLTVVDGPGSGVLELKIAVIDIKPIARVSEGGNDVIKYDPNIKGSKFELDAVDSQTGELVFAISTLLKGDEYATPDDSRLSALLEKEFSGWIGFLVNSLEKAKAEAETGSFSLSMTNLRNITYGGIADVGGPVTLLNGSWTGDPFVPGGAARPRVTLIDDYLLKYDVDRDGSEDGVVFLVKDSGGTGKLIHLAIVARKGGRLENVATVFLGDRVQVRRVFVRKGRLVVDVLQPADGDQACCPGDFVRREWTLKGGKLAEEKSSFPRTRVSIGLLSGTEWVLQGSQPAITVRFDKEKVSGSGGCNNYFAKALPGPNAPSEISIGAIASTKKACEEPSLSAEESYLRKLEAVRGFSFLTGRLALAYNLNSQDGVLVFEEKPR